MIDVAHFVRCFQAPWMKGKATKRMAMTAIRKATAVPVGSGAPKVAPLYELEGDDRAIGKARAGLYRVLAACAASLNGLRVA